MSIFLSTLTVFHDSEDGFESSNPNTVPLSHKLMPAYSLRWKILYLVGTSVCSEEMYLHTIHLYTEATSIRYED